MESGSWLTSAGVTGPVSGGAGWYGRQAGEALAEGAGKAGASCF